MLPAIAPLEHSSGTNRRQFAGVDPELLRPETREQYQQRLAADHNTSRWARSPGTRRGAGASSSQHVTAGRSGAARSEVVQAPDRVVAAPFGDPPSDHPRYELLGVIGRGKSTTVYKGYDREVQRFVAIKELTEQEQAERFWTTARFLGGLVHDNIVRVYDFERERRWVVMELMRGNLEDRLREDAPLDADLARSVLKQALSGLEYLHQQGKLHGELSPRALLIDDEGRIRLCDSPGYVADSEFSLPRDSARQLAPELLSPAIFGPVGPPTDLYRLGFTLIELLLGARFVELFQSRTTQPAVDTAAWLRWHASPAERLPDLDVCIPGLPADLKLVLTRMTQKKVRDRYASATEAIRDLTERPLVPVDVIPRGEAAENGASPGAGPSLPGAITIGAPINIYADPSEPVGEGESWMSRLTDVDWLRAQFRRPKVLWTTLALAAALVLLIAFGAGWGRARVRLVTEPPGAVILVDDQPWDAPTPATLRLKTGRSYLFRFEAPGYAPRNVKQEINGDTTIRQVLSPVRTAATSRLPSPEEPRASVPDEVSVLVDSFPQGATVFVSGQAGQSTTPARISLVPGQFYEFEFRLEGYQPLVQRYLVRSADEDAAVRVQLEPLPAEPVMLSIDSDPPGASFSVDGTPRGALTPALIKLVRGRKYALGLTADGFEPVEWMVDLSGDGFETRFFHTLRPVTGAEVTGIPETTAPLPAGETASMEPWPVAGVTNVVDAALVANAIRTILDAAWLAQNPDEGVALATRAYESALLAGANEPRLHMAYALLLGRRHRYGQSRGALEQAIEVQTRNWNSYQPIADLVARPSVQPYLDPFRELIRVQLVTAKQDPHELERAMLTCERYLEALEAWLPASVESAAHRAARRRNVEYLGTSLAVMRLVFGPVAQRRFDLERRQAALLGRLNGADQALARSAGYDVAERLDQLRTADAATFDGRRVRQQERDAEGYYPRHSININDTRETLDRSTTRHDRIETLLDTDEFPYQRELTRNRRTFAERTTEFRRTDRERLLRPEDHLAVDHFLPPAQESKRSELLRTLPDPGAPLPASGIVLVSEP